MKHLAQDLLDGYRSTCSSCSNNSEWWTWSSTRLSWFLSIICPGGLVCAFPWQPAVPVKCWTICAEHCLRHGIQLPKPFIKVSALCTKTVLLSLATHLPAPWSGSSAVDPALRNGKRYVRKMIFIKVTQEMHDRQSVKKEKQIGCSFQVLHLNIVWRWCWNWSL